MSSVDSRRYETKFWLPDDKFAANFHATEVTYNQPFVHTIYFGGPNKPLNGVAVRLRQYKDTSPEQPLILNNADPAFLEVKVGNEGKVARKKRKFRTELELNQAIKILSSTDNFHTLEDNNLLGTNTAFPVGLLAAISARENLMGLVPFGVVTYMRRHFVLEEGRATLDSNLTYWGVTRFSEDYYAYPIGKEPPGFVLELKLNTNQPGLATNHPFVLATRSLNRTSGKFSKLRQGLSQSEPVLITNHEMQGSVENGDWDLLEREFKLDLSADGQQVLKELKLDPDYYSIGGLIESESYQQFVIAGESGICLMRRRNEGPIELIKVKTTTSSHDDLLIRKEKIYKYSPSELERLVDLVNGNSLDSHSYTDTFIRRRLQRNVLCRKTGNIFNIFVDICEDLDNIHSFLYQCEVEFHGRLDSGRSLNPVSADEDFSNLKISLTQAFQEKGIDAINSVRTKYQWISS